MSRSEEKERMKETLDEFLKPEHSKLGDAHDFIHDTVRHYLSSNQSPEDKALRNKMYFAATMLYHKAFADNISVAGLALFIAYMIVFLVENLENLAEIDKTITTTAQTISSESAQNN